MAITIQISEENWNNLKNMKVRPSETFDDILSYLLKKEEKENES